MKTNTSKTKQQKERVILIDNPTNLPIAPLDDFVLFQEDLKFPISDEALQALKKSIIDHRIFISKAVAKFNGELLTEDGHQTFAALKSLRDQDHYTKCQVIRYVERDGNMHEDGYDEYDNIQIPYQLIVPKGCDDIERKKDAAVKVAIINSQYAEINPQTTFFSTLGFNTKEIADLMLTAHIPELSFTNFGLLGFPGVGEDADGDTELGELYSRKITIPLYEITGEKPDIQELVNTEKADTLVQQLENNDIPELEKQFLIRAAYRYDVFDYGKIAEYYAHSSKELQVYFEQLVLIIIDLNQAIEQGLVAMSTQLEEQYIIDTNLEESYDEI